MVLSCSHLGRLLSGHVRVNPATTAWLGMEVAIHLIMSIRDQSR